MTSHGIQTRSATDPAANGEGAPASIALVRSVDDRSAVAAPSMAGTVALRARVAAALTIACGVIALAVHVWFAAAARRWLAFPFAGIPARPGEAASIFIHNLRALAAVGGLLLIAQSAYWTAGTAQPGPLHGTLRRLGEALLGAAVTANLIVIGASFGAYGTRMLRAALPHGPVELAAYSLALSLYLQGSQAAAPGPSPARGNGAQRLDARDRRRSRDLREPMRSARTVVCMLLVAGGLVASAVLVPRAIRTLHPFAFQPLTAAGASQPTAHRRRAARHRTPRPRRSRSRPSRTCRRSALVDERRIVRVARASRHRERRRRAADRSADARAGRAPRASPRPPRVRAV